MFTLHSMHILLVGGSQLGAASGCVYHHNGLQTVLHPRNISCVIGMFGAKSNLLIRFGYII
jgi:hypothetical protein